MSIYVMQAKKNDRWIDVRDAKTGGVIYSETKEPLLEYVNLAAGVEDGPITELKLRVVEFPGFVHHSNWPSDDPDLKEPWLWDGFTLPDAAKPVMRRIRDALKARGVKARIDYIGLLDQVVEYLEGKDNKLTYAALSKALSVFESGPDYRQDAVVTMGPQHFRELGGIMDGNNNPVLEGYGFGDPTLFGYRVKVEANTAYITIQNSVSGAVYTLF